MKHKNTYKHQEIDQKWQKVWQEEKIYTPDLKNAKKPYYNLMMFPYPSAEGLHVGNMYAFTGADVYGRFKRMQGYDIFEPIGLDGFGIHSENYALKVGRHPKEQAKRAEENFYRQLASIGNGFAWDHRLETYDPNYYKWTQWLFIEMFKNGLAYRKKSPVNWCPSCKTVLADEQVIAGECERCSSQVEKRDLEQWFFRITEYADQLLENIEGLDWSPVVKTAQTNWIGKSEGARLTFSIFDDQSSIEVFTTRPDTLYGATFMVVAPEHAIVTKLLDAEFPSHNPNIEQVRDYVEQAKNKTDIERTNEEKEKTGVFSGLYAINPANGEKIPVWIADYVLAGYGTGAIMAVPAHDERDFAFATKYHLPICRVIHQDGAPLVVSQAYTGEGALVNSDLWNGWRVPAEMDKVLDDLERRGIGKREANFHLRDWLISRQRYWGPPIPLIFCQSCEEKVQKLTSSGSEYGQGNEEFSKGEIENPGWIAVKDDQLPVLLPDVEDWRPEGTGKAPLANHPEFYNTTCPHCGGPARRETDVSDTFLDSAWYFLRYPSIDTKDASFDTEITKKWLPVNSYIGGAEHSVLHLLYSRFITSFLHKMNYLDFEEPFTTFRAHGLIIKDGAKMSKSKGNVVIPDEYIAKYGADTLRAYLMFLGPLSGGGDFRDSGIEGMYRFMKRMWIFLSSVKISEQEDEEVVRMLHKTIKAVTLDTEELTYNTAIARLMELYNFTSKRLSLSFETAIAFVKLLAPFAPHMTEELYQFFRNQHAGANSQQFESVHQSAWPEYDEKYIVSNEVIIVIQVNGKRRGEVKTSGEKVDEKAQIEEMAKSEIKKYLEGKEVKKVIYIPGKIINFVV